MKDDKGKIFMDTISHNQYREEIKKRLSGELPRRVVSLIALGHKPKCACCGAKKELTFDHVIPLSKGGLNRLSNGQILCGNCNGIKSDDIISLHDLKIKVNLVHLRRQKAHVGVIGPVYSGPVSGLKKTFLILPYSNSENRANGVRYCEAERIEQRGGYLVGYFKQSKTSNPQEFYCKTLNDLYTVGNVTIEKCMYDITGIPVTQINQGKR